MKHHKKTYKTAFLRKTALVCALFFGLGSFLQAQDISISAKLDTNAILIGGQTGLHFEVVMPENAEIIFPEFKDTLTAEVEVVAQSKTDTTKRTQNARFIQLHKKLTITAFDSGGYSIPPQRFLFKRRNRIDTLSSNSLFLSVNTVPVDTTQAIKDIKPPEEAPMTLKEFFQRYYPYMLLALALILVTLGVVLYHRRLKHKPIFRAKPQEPPHVVALRELDELKSKKLWQQGKFKPYHSRLTEILRIYIEERFDIPALEQTSDEILQAFIHTQLIEDQQKQELEQMLRLADMVKFAKEQPIAHENQQSWENARNFVEQTKQEKPPAEEKTQNKQPAEENRQDETKNNAGD